MKTTKLLKTLTLAAGLFAGSAATAGDIYEIRPCDKDGTAAAAYTTADKPLSAGETLYFKLRLIPRTFGGHVWQLGYIGTGSKILEDALNPLQIGVYVSGKLTYATLVGEIYNDSSKYSDFIFSYTTQAGDFALPIVLATENGPADEVSASEFYLNPLRSDKWAFVDVDLNLDGRPSGWSTTTPLGASDTCSLQYWSVPGSGYPADPGCFDGSSRETDCTLKSAGFYVKTVDFADSWEEDPGEDPATDPGLWRSVHEGSTSTIGNSPQIVSEAGSVAEKVTLYVWSDDESAVYVKGGTLTEVTTGYVGGVAQTVKLHIGTVTLVGTTAGDFSIYGVKEGGTANLVLSPYAGYRFDSTKTLLADNYITVPVKCVEPLPTSIVVEREDKSVSTFTANTVADDAYLNAITRVAVYPTQAPTADITVTVNPTFQADGTKTNWGDYIRFSTLESVETLPAGDTAPTVTFTAGSTEKQYLYVYALRAEKAYTIGTGKQIQLTPVADATALAAAGISTLTGTGLNIDANAPTLSSPTAETTLSATAGDTLDVPIALDDIYADYTDKTIGYTVTMTFNGLSQTQTTTFIPAGEGEQLVGKDDDSILPQIKIPSTLLSGDYTATVKVTSPIRKLASAVTTFKVTVAGAKTMSAELSDTESEGVYNEGETIGFKIALSDAPGTEVYAFLVSDEDDISGLFGGANASAILGQNDLAAAVATSSGIKISAAGTTATGRFQVLDGSQDGTPYAFNVVLCSSKRFNPDNIVKGYANADGINLTIYNVEPAFDASEPCYVNGFAVTDGELFGNEYPKGQTQTIKPNFTDVAYDLRHGFQYKYTITQGTKSAANGTVGHADTLSDITVAEGTSINTQGFTYNFPNAGTYTIKIQMKDKDMDSWAAATMAFQINIVNSPVLSVAMDEGYESYLETMNKAHVNVTLPYYPDTGVDQVVVKVTVTPPVGTNPGELTLDNEYKTVPAGYAALADNEYYVIFTEKATESMLIDTMDGTTLSVAKGFSVTAEVMNTEESIETGKTWAEYYKAGSAKVYIENVMPVFVNVTLENTNAWKVAGGAATSYPIKFTIRSDVDQDLAGITGFPGIKVTLSANDGTVTPTPANGTWNEFYVSDAGSSYTFTPDFGSLQGDQTVTLTIEDKDGGFQSWTYLYTVEASKVLITRAAGPSGGTANQPSPKYANAAGHGEGRVWADGMKISSGSGHDFKWNCSKEQSVSVFGYGYKTGDTEAAALPGTTTYKVNATGGVFATGDEPYAYGDDTFDSFLYTWIVYTAGDGDSSSAQLTASLLSGIAPETPGKTLAAARLALPTEQNEDGSYAESEIEGVFSKEWRKDDNCGDINQDGIPDLAILKYGLGVYDVDAGEVTGNDLSDVSAYNDDADYLPAGTSGGLDIIPNIADNWPSQGSAFNAYLELRGFGVGLNAGYPNGDGSAQNPDYTANEQRAYLAWKGLATEDDLKGMTDDAVATLFEANLADAAADLSAATTAGTVSANNGKVTAGWSPENPTDPTASDSDSDTLPDGYEYWFWYAAKVGFTETDANGNAVWTGRLVGKRFQAANLEEFVDIPSDDICEAFNPNVNGASEGNAVTRGSLATRDFDNDGLTDLEELAMGTNPVSCDTDGDTLPDGYEVMWGLNPLNVSDGDGGDDQNPDGDAMAMATFRGQILQVGDAAPYTFYLTEVTDPIAGGDTVKASSIGTGDTLDDCLRTINGKTIPKTITAAEDVTFDATPEVATNPGITLIHDQVYKLYGFDPRTAWSLGCAHGALSARWCLLENTTDENVQKVNDARSVVNTAPYTTKWEYLYGKYTGAATGTGSALTVLRTTSTNPNGAFEDKTYGTNTTTWASTQHGADTNGDGVPDGWEIYCGGDPIATASPWGSQNSDFDDLANAAEYAGMDSVAAYAACGTISSNNTVAAGWLNKLLPTDPNSSDTDGDGLSDSAEGAGWNDTFMAGRQSWSAAFTFIYGDATDDGKALCFRGGGLNPCNSDTDFDGLPDGWEHQYAGIVVTPEGKVADQANNLDEMYTDQLKICDGVAISSSSSTNAVTATPSGNYIMGGMDGTDGHDDSTHITLVDAIVGVIRDRDFDHDGLENYQEYLVQSVRAWRYDDTETPLNGRSVIWGEGTATRSDYVQGGFVSMDVVNGEHLMNAVKESVLWDTIKGSLLYDYDDSTFDYRALGYFAEPDHEWDPMQQMGRRYMRVPSTMIMYADGPYRVTASVGYVSTDPRLWDTDQDGMDDYWEIFHGINPLLGGEDIIGTSYAPSQFPQGMGPITYEFNVWNGLGGFYDIDDPGLDPLLAPWTTGLPDADPDGDGLRNLDEAIMGNMTSPTTYHTDPSPYWMTDDSSPMSVTSQYYPMDDDLTLLGYGWTWGYDTGLGSNAAQSSADIYRFSFERTEGYDTDGDFRGDSHEIVNGVENASDPLDANDLDRRQALYLDGNDSCAYSYSEGNVAIKDAYDVFRQFTVECWVKPERFGQEQTVLERGFTYGASNVVNDEPVWRANFRIAIDQDGFAYGMFDNDNAVTSGSGEGASSQTLKSGLALETNVWAHLALTYDGTYLRFYQNGEERGSVKSGLIPANGIYAILQEPQSTNAYPMASYLTLAGANTIGARRAGPTFRWDETIADQFVDFYQGYVSEVRIWDGARTAEQLAANYKKSFSTADIVTNRLEVYEAWANGATRNDNDGRNPLPAQLMIAYNFNQLPSAVNAADVAQVPPGYEAGALANCVTDGKGSATPTEAVVRWWNDTPLHSTVYNDYHVVPYIQNAIHHLPMLDGSFTDSLFWHEKLAAYTLSVTTYNLNTYMIPNGGNPYTGRSHMSDTDFREWRYDRYAKVSGEAIAETIVKQYQFQLSREYTGLDDLLPLGGAFAKRSADYWDGQGATAAWTATGADTDGDDLPDWWEAYAVAHYGAEAGTLSPTATVNYKGTKMTAAEAYIRDLAHGMQPDTTTDTAYVNRVDVNLDGLPDWWATIYHLEDDAEDDTDGDGLCNYTEYLLSEVFNLGKTFSPVNAYSVYGRDTDYFFKIGQLYAGDIFTDHDFMEDAWEAGFGVDYTSRLAWDANADTDEDCWSTFAECRYNQFCGSILSGLISHVVDESLEAKDHPIPTLQLTLRYNYSQPISRGGTEETETAESTDSEATGDNQVINTSAPLIIKTYTHRALRADNVVEDATFTVQPGETFSRSFYVGAWGEHIIRGHLSPGYVEVTDVTFSWRNVEGASTYTWTCKVCGDHEGSYAALTSDRERHGGENITDVEQEPGWELLTDDVGLTITVSRDADDTLATILVEGESIGTIDIITGEFNLDLGELGYAAMRKKNEDIAAARGLDFSEAELAADLKKMIFKIGYKSEVPTLQKNKLMLYLGEANTGVVREGTNTIMAFYDIDEDGDYTPGEPFGTTTVDVGWSEATGEIDLTDVSPVITRCNLSTGSSDDSGSSVESDRNDLYGTDDGDNYELVSGDLSGGAYQRIRIVRTLINGYGIDTLNIPNRVLVDKWIELDQRKFFYEGDVLGEGIYDLDWQYFDSEVNDNAILANYGIEPTDVTYRIVLGNGTVDTGATNNLLTVATVRHFDTKKARQIPLALQPGAQAAAVYGARPTFKWSMNGNNSYTAFRVLIQDGSTTVWDSGLKMAPATDLDGIYTYEPEVYAGDQLETAKNYSWKVSMYNAKFRSDAFSTNSITFRMNTVTNGMDYGSIKVCAKYFGPATVLEDGNVYVEAFTTPDFTGSPVGRAVATKAMIGVTNVAHTANATILGLPKGTYYVRAYVDNTYGTDRKRDDWESWGYVCPRYTSPDKMFMPTAITLGDEVGAGETFTCYIEDVDTNGNCLPDAWEMLKNNGKLDTGTESITDTTKSGIAINSAVTANLAALEGDGSGSNGLAAYAFSVVRNAGVAALALDVDTTGYSTYSAALATVSSDTTADATDVTITSISVTPNGTAKITATIGATTSTTTSTTTRKAALATAATGVYETTSSTSETTLTGRVECKDNLADAWTDSGKTVTITVTENGAVETGDIDLSSLIVGKSQMFFRIVIDK